MKKLERRFEVVPIAEVLKKAIQVDGKKLVEKLDKKEEPYAVPARSPAESL